MMFRKRMLTRGLCVLAMVLVAVTCTSWADMEGNKWVERPDVKLENVISEIRFSRQDDGFQMSFDADLRYYDKENLPEYETIDCMNYQILDGEGQVIGKQQIAVNMAEGVATVENVCETRRLKAGETISIYMDLASSSVNYGNSPTPLFGWNGEVRLFGSIPVTLPSVEELLFTSDVRVSKKDFQRVFVKWDYTNYAHHLYLDADGFLFQTLESNGETVVEDRWMDLDDMIWDDGYQCRITVPLGKEYKVKITPFYLVNDQPQFGGTSKMITVTAGPIHPPKAKVTKISKKKAAITIDKGSATGVIIYQKVNGKWKKLITTTKSKYTITKNAAGTRSYKLKAYKKHNGKTYYSAYSTVYTPKENVKKYDPVYDAGEYGELGSSWVEPIKIYYDNGKLKVKALFINNNRFKAKDFEYKITVKSGKTIIGTRTIDVGPVNSRKFVVKTITLKNSKAGYDLRNGKITIERKKIDVSR